MVVVFRNGSKERVNLVSEGQDELKKWGTELDPTNRDRRDDVDYIELYLNHPLLNHGLVLIDTPGLESIQEHHEEITRRAIDTAHIAIWVQSTNQLGGNRREWQFMKETVRKCFRKFLTVVNAWDYVLEPQDDLEKQTPPAVRERDKMNIVRGQFRKMLANVPEEELNTMISERNLFGVSAKWALQGTDAQKARSGLDKLSARIQEICSGEEARAEIFYKPMKQLCNLQHTLEQHLSESLQALETDKTLDQQKRDCELLKSECTSLEYEMNNSLKESQIDHDRICKDFIRDIKENIAEPLKDLKQEIDFQVSPDYVRERILAKDHNVTLPETLQEAYKASLQEVDNKWNELRLRIPESLKELRQDYAKEMDKHVGSIASNLNNLDISLPDLDIQCDLDLGSLEKFYTEKMRIEESISDAEEQINDFNERIDKEAPNETLVKNAREALRRAERQLVALGGQPMPYMRQESIQVSKGGMYSSPRYRTVDVPDYTPVEEWKEQHSKIEATINNKEKALDDIIRAEEAKTGRRLSMEAAKRRLEQQMDKMRANKAAAELQQQQELEKIVARTHRQLVHSTSGQLEKYIRIMEKNAVDGLTKVFEQQIQYLEGCVKEQFMEPLRSKQTALEEAVAAFDQGKDEIEKRKTQFEKALQDLHSLQEKTAACCAR